MALAGSAGHQIATLLKATQDAGTEVLIEATAASLARQLPRNLLATNRLWSDLDRAKVLRTLEAAVAAADLLGRSRIQALHEQHNVAAFAESDPKTPLDGFLAYTDQPIPALEPTGALDYFRGLIPRLDLSTEAFVAAVRRQAFTMAVATEQTLLERVQALVTRQMQTGDPWSGTTADIQDLLDEAGVSPRNPQYAEMVWRTNTMDAYNTGAEDEIRRDPEVFGFFPVWQYLGIADGRQGKDHEPHFGKFYPNTARFADVRGDRPFNCRCTWRPVSRLEWARLQAAGAVLETTW